MGKIYEACCHWLKDPGLLILWHFLTSSNNTSSVKSETQSPLLFDRNYFALSIVFTYLVDTAPNWRTFWRRLYEQEPFLVVAMSRPNFCPTPGLLMCIFYRILVEVEASLYHYDPAIVWSWPNTTAISSSFLVCTTLWAYLISTWKCLCQTVTGRQGFSWHIQRAQLRPNAGSTSSLWPVD